MYILGINRYAHDSSAALLKDGSLIFAAAEERFSRVKKDRGFPRRAIRAALEFAGIQFGDLDAIAFGWNRPGATPLHTDRKSTRLNSSHVENSYAVFCLKKKKRPHLRLLR